MVDRSRALPYQPTSEKQREIRNALDLIALGEVGEDVGIDLEDDRLAGEVRCSLLHLGRNCATWSAPRRPKIDDNRHTRAGDDVVELLLGADIDRDRVRLQHRLALAARAGIGKMAHGDPILGSTGSADAPHEEMLRCAGGEDEG